MRLAFLVLALLALLSCGISSISHGKYSAHVLCGSIPAPCLRLRGGFFNLPSAASGGASGGESKGSGETATADDFKDADAAKATPDNAVSAPAGAGQDAAAAAAAAPVSLQQHVSEYALAGSLDGLRTGLGQSIGGIVNLWVSAALQSTGHLSSLAFASAVCAFQEHQVLPASHSPCRPTRMCVRVEWSLDSFISYACIHALMHEYIRTDVQNRRDDGQNADRHHIAQAWKAVVVLRQHKGCQAHASAS